MPTIPDVVVPKATWVNLYTLTSITVGTHIRITNKGSDAVTIATSSTQPTVVQLGDMLDVGVNQSMDIAASTISAWAYSSNGTTLSVQSATRDKQRNGATMTTSAHSHGMPFDHAVSLGLITGVRRVTALGNNPDIDTTTLPEDVWPVGGMYPWPSSATTLNILCSNVNDTSTGTGARTITIAGLDANYAEVTEVVTLATNPSTTTTINSFLRVNSTSITSTGTGRINAGDIDIRRTGFLTEILARIPAGKGTHRSSGYTVPAGHTLCVTSIFIGINRPTVKTDASVATYFGSPNGFYRLPLEISMADNPYRHEANPPIMVLEKNDFILQGSYVSESNANITAAWNGLLYQTSVVNVP
jgi:hypothetical protein